MIDTKATKLALKNIDSSKTYSLTDLLNYQTGTGIEGPKYHNTNEPVSILKHMTRSIPCEGYGRTLIAIATNNVKICGYAVESLT